MQEAPLTGLGYADPVPRNVISIMCDHLSLLEHEGAKWDGSLTLRSLNAESIWPQVSGYLHLSTTVTTSSTSLYQFCLLSESSK